MLKVLTPIWQTKPETARRVRQRIKVVLEWARAAGHRTGENPVDLIGDALPKSSKTNVEHHVARAGAWPGESGDGDHRFQSMATHALNEPAIAGVPVDGVIGLRAA